jgi:hypothetical protein
MGRIERTSLAHQRSSEVFSQQIQPLLANIPTCAIRSRIGVSRWYAGKIRQGYQPHPRHWEALAELVGVVKAERELPIHMPQTSTVTIVRSIT